MIIRRWAGAADTRAKMFILILIPLLLTPAHAQAQSAPATRGDSADIKGALLDSVALLAIEHGIRLALQPGTREELRGNFWRDYQRSVHVPVRWEDSDRWLVNYVGHPIHGAAAGYVWLEHDPGAPVEIEFDNAYWASRGRASLWSAIYSFQFEIGPISEASIGNVGLRPETRGWVDYVVTPTGAFGLVIAEDALDRFVVKLAERHTTNRVWRASLRLIFSPARAMANTAAGHLPWYRPDRSLSWR
jgi:hypothetical protein